MRKTHVKDSWKKVVLGIVGGHGYHVSRNRSPIHLECEIISIGKADIGQIVEKVDGTAAVVLKCDAVVRLVIPWVAREDADEVPDPENLGVVRPSGADDVRDGG